MINILVVDDSSLSRKRTIQAIETIDIEHTIVAEAENGEEALQKFREYSIDVVITDIEMPIMSGIILTQELRYLTQELYIIVLSSMVRQEIKQKIKKDKNSFYLKKPLKKELLEDILGRLSHVLEKKELT